MQLSGYSGLPLAKKLGIKDGFIIKLVNQPHYYFQLFTDMPHNITVVTDATIKKNFIHCFVTKTEDYYSSIVSLRSEIVDNGMIWISWYKKSSKIPTDVTENLIREAALKNGLVDVKVCAIDELWSGLKLVIPVKQRMNDKT